MAEGDFVEDRGHCSADCFNTPGTDDFIECDDPESGGDCVVGSCMDGDFTVPANTEIKTLLKGSSMAPWVKLWFETNCCSENPGDPGCNPDPDCIPMEETLITTGNISQPGGDEKCRAAIKSFQYSWGGINAGNVCKISIFDEAGGSFNAWFKRLARNPLGASLNSPHGVYKMKVQWGWIISGTSDDVCPTIVEQGTTGNCDDEPEEGKPILLCSPCLWFLPTNITCQFQNGKFMYELEGVDLLMEAGRTPARRVFGGQPIGPAGSGQVRKTYFLDAVVALSQISQPPFNVKFLQLPESGEVSNANEPQPLKFWRQPNQSGIQIANYVEPNGPDAWKICPDGAGNPVPCSVGMSNVDDLEKRGPLGVWDTHGLNPLAAIQSWLGHGVRAQTMQGERVGKGITMNYDSSSQDAEANCEDIEVEENQPNHGTLILWANANPTCIAENQTFGKRLMALYIVNGGKCSPVISFSPNIKWNFTAAMAAGGGLGTDQATAHNAHEQLKFNPCAIFGEAPRYQGSTPNNLRDNSFGGNAEREHIISMAEHLRANYLHNSIEAELRVQGDPAKWLCSPIFGYGRTVAILFINPFFLKDPENAEEGDCPQWSNKLEETDSEGIDYDTSCNEILSNRNWFIKGVDHQIKEGSYITTLKIILFNPGSDFSGRTEDKAEPASMMFGAGDSNILTLGGDPGIKDMYMCQQATWTCTDKIVQGGQDLEAGTNTFCEKVCNSDLYVT